MGRGSPGQTFLIDLSPLSHFSVCFFQCMCTLTYDKQGCAGWGLVQECQRVLELR